MSKAFSQEFLVFNEASPTPFHVCKYWGDQLEAAGFVKITEDVAWKNIVVAGKSKINK